MKKLLRDGLTEQEMRANLAILYNVCEFMMPNDVRYRFVFACPPRGRYVDLMWD